MLSETPNGNTRHANFVIFVISPTFMKYVDTSQPVGEPRVVPGKDWLFDTRIFTEIDTHWVEEFQIAGSRVIYSTTNYQSKEVRIEVIDFNPDVAARAAGVSQKQWDSHSAATIKGPNETEITATFGCDLIQDDFADPVVCAMPYTVSVRVVKMDADEVVYHEVCIDEERLVFLKVCSLSFPRSKADLVTMIESRHPWPFR